MKSMMAPLDNDVLNDLSHEQDISVIQDSVHIATKLRNRNLRCSVAMPMGNKQVSASHLKILINSVPKDVHGLVRSDILPEDRQNYRSFEKITDIRVLDALKRHVVDSEATIMYLKISKQITSAFIEINVDPLERVHRIWHGLYFLRAWRKWMLNLQSINDSAHHTVTKIFLSHVAFTCVELNAYNLLHLIIKFRNAKTPELFLPTLFQSQACEQTFRQLRSMTTMSWTKINFSLLELIHQIGRIELQNNIVFFGLAKMDVSLPRIQNRTNKLKVYSLPTNEQIKKTLENAQSAALFDASKFGIEINASDIIRCEIQKSEIKKARPDVNQLSDSIEFRNDDTESIHSNLQRSDVQNECDIDERHVQIFDADGSAKSILKSSLVWILSETKGILSNDRLQRVQSHSGSSKKRKTSIEGGFQSKRNKQSGIRVETDIQIGDWCFFKDCLKPSSSMNFNENIIFGAILGFRYIDGKTDKDRAYTLDYAPVFCDQSNKKRGIEVLGTWYRYTRSEKLGTLSANNNFFVNINNYIATADAPLAKQVSNESQICYVLPNYTQTAEILMELSAENGCNSAKII